MNRMLSAFILAAVIFGGIAYAGSSLDPGGGGGGLSGGVASDLVAGSAVVADSEVVDSLTISGGTIDNTPIGATTTSTVKGTTLTATTSATLNTGAGTDAVLTEGGVDKSSGSTETWALQNSGAGVANLTVDGSITSGAGVAVGGALSGATTGAFSSTVTISGASTDITTGTNEDLTLDPNGTGSVVLASGDNVIDIVASDGNTNGRIATTTGGAKYADFGTANSSGGLLHTDSTLLILSNVTARSATARTACVKDQYASGGPTSNLDWCVYGAGLVVHEAGGRQSVTIADDGAGTSPTDTTTPTSSWIEVTCNDANGCNYNPGETSMVQGAAIYVLNVSASNTVTINDSAGVVEVRGAASLALAANEAATCNYTGSLWSCR